MLARIIRRAIPDDAGEVVDLMRQSFRPADLELTIYGCEGIAAYLQFEFAQSPAFSTSRYWVAVIENRIVGFVELRDAGNGPHLNYIATAGRWRKMGLGREMLAKALLELNPSPDAQFTLDVFKDNELALAWYLRRGFRVLQRKAFWRIAPPESAAPSYRVEGLPHAEAAHRVFSFSSFMLTRGECQFVVGRLGKRWYRLTDGRLLQPQVLQTLHFIDPRREFLFVGTEESIPADARTFCSPLLWSLSMGQGL